MNGNGTNQSSQSRTSSNPVGDAVVVSPIAGSAEIVASCAEVYTDDYESGLSEMRCYLTIPTDAERGQIMRINMNGTEKTLQIPGYVSPGEKVVVVANLVSTPLEAKLI